jgi:integrase
MECEHIVPLSKQAAALLGELKTHSTGAFVFAGDKLDRAISQNTMIYGCYRMGYRGRQTAHGLRGIASTWANEAECYRPDWVEMALAHAERDEVRARTTAHFTSRHAGACSRRGLISYSGC